jgi:hypothetical protein
MNFPYVLSYTATYKTLCRRRLISLLLLLVFVLLLAVISSYGEGLCVILISPGVVSI